MPNEIGSRARYGEAFWHAHHEAWHRPAPMLAARSDSNNLAALRLVGRWTHNRRRNRGAWALGSLCSGPFDIH